MIYVYIYCLSVFLAVLLGYFSVENLDSSDKEMKNKLEESLIRLSIMPIFNTLGVIIFSAYLTSRLIKKLLTIKKQ